MQHARDRLRAGRLVRVFLNGTVFGCSRSQGLPLEPRLVLHEEFNAHCRETDRGGATRAVRRRFLGKEARRALDREPRNRIIQALQNGRAKRRLIKL